MIFTQTALLALGFLNGALAIPAGETRSADGSCGQVSGKAITCQGSVFGNCCSMYGYCGSTPGYCGSGCQSAFGTCGTSSTPSSTAKASEQTTTSSQTAQATGAAKSLVYRGACGDKAQQVVSNPGFENGLTGWTASGGAKLAAYTAATSYPCVKQNIYDLGGSSSSGVVAVSYDWAFMVNVKGRGPPAGSCTMVADGRS
ncbi:hypothetical protein MAPG_04931 [Magnaporthiopsis poae ATCC 64411]|uniref:Chitin-binding type-1 domain-containing protein n=1 Tax=Magnaporthiopsis poae (strain ATCC 64411 / 73-15) TaxID=644358 RepID=A0A0C4DY22_MAGP6|nr:hypothetical protein MAPG_04931 [Magnaporthiopsis poae ATCC 64411]